MPKQTNTNQPINYTPAQPSSISNNSNRSPIVIILIIVGVLGVLCACCIGILIFTGLVSNSGTSYTSSCANGVCTVKVCKGKDTCITDKCYADGCQDNLRSKLERELKQ